MYLDNFDGHIEFRRWPVTAINSVKYIYGGTLTTIDPSIYQVDIRGQNARITSVYGTAWPIPDFGTYNSVQVAATVGFTSYALIPPTIRLAVLMLAADWFENREDTVEKQMSKIPNGVDRLIRISRYRQV